MDMRTVEPTKLVLRLPPEVHQKLQEAAEVHRRSLNSEIVHALTRYVEGVVEIRYIWATTEEDERTWTNMAGETLSDEDAWEFTAEEEAQVTRALQRQPDRSEAS
jgi:uncharacterized protein (DUF1778 family)